MSAASLPSSLMSWLSRGARWLWPFYLLGVFGAWTALVLRAARLQQGHVSSDWLLDYRFGFIRRGLPGEFVWFLNDVLGVAAVYGVAALQIAAVGVLLAGVWRLSRRVSVPLAGWFLAYSPATLMFSLFGLTEPGRKEVLLFALFAVLAQWLLSWRDRMRHGESMSWVLALVAGSLTTLMMLSHELTFLYLPWLAWLCWLGFPAGSVLKRASLLAAVFIGPVLAFAALLVWGGSLERQAFCSSFMDAGLSASICQGVLTFPIDDLHGSLSNTRAIVGQFAYVQTYALGVVLALLPILLAGMAERVPYSFKAAAGVLGCVLWSLPLFAVAVDWGRFIQIHLVLGLVLWLFAAHRGQIVTPPSGDQHRPSWHWGWSGLMLLGVVSLGVWNLPVCCEHGVGHGVIGHVLSFMTG